MISSGFETLDRVIGGLKKGKLYALATFNFDHSTAEYFALNMVANTQRPAFFYSKLMESARMTVPAFAGMPLFHVGDMDDDNRPASQFPREGSFWGREAAGSAEELCDRFESHHRNTPFELAVFAIGDRDENDRTTVRLAASRAIYGTETQRAGFAARQRETAHRVGLFRTLAEKHHIPVILIGRFDDWKSRTPPEDFLKPGDQLALLETAENILLLSRAGTRSICDFELTVFKHFLRPEKLPVYQYPRETAAGNHA